MTTQTCFELSELQFSAQYSFQQVMQIRGVLATMNQGSFFFHHYITHRAYLKMDLPHTPELILSYMLNHAQECDQEVLDKQAKYDTGEGLYTVEVADDITALVERANYCYRYAHKLRDLGVIPQSINWVIWKRTHEEENTLIVFPFVLRGAIAMTKKDYADAHGDARDALETLCQQMEMEAGKEEGVSHLCIDESTITAQD